MAVISPVSGLRNYNTVLDKVEYGSPVYLTVNGRGRYAIRDLDTVFSDVPKASSDIELTHQYLDDLQDKVEEVAKRPEARLYEDFVSHRGGLKLFLVILSGL